MGGGSGSGGVSTLLAWPCPQGCDLNGPSGPCPLPDTARELGARGPPRLSRPDEKAGGLQGRGTKVCVSVCGHPRLPLIPAPCCSAPAGVASLPGHGAAQVQPVSALPHRGPEREGSERPGTQETNLPRGKDLCPHSACEDKARMGSSVAFCTDGPPAHRSAGQQPGLSLLSRRATGTQRALRQRRTEAARSAHRDPDAGRSRGHSSTARHQPRGSFWLSHWRDTSDHRCRRVALSR